jgi:hypothetical protein
VRETSCATREFMAMCAIAQPFGRPGTPTDQAWIESLFSHVKAEWPHLDRIRDPQVLRAELAVVRHEYNTIRLHAAQKGLLALLDADLAGPVIVLSAPQEQVEQQALELVRKHALRAMDAWHLAVATITVPPLLAPGEERAFASRDQAQRAVAKQLGSRSKQPCCASC